MRDFLSLARRYAHNHRVSCRQGSKSRDIPTSPPQYNLIGSRYHHFERHESITNLMIDKGGRLGPLCLTFAALAGITVPMYLMSIVVHNWTLAGLWRLVGEPV